MINQDLSIATRCQEPATNSDHQPLSSATSGYEWHPQAAASVPVGSERQGFWGPHGNPWSRVPVMCGFSNFIPYFLPCFTMIRKHRIATHEDITHRLLYSCFLAGDQDRPWLFSSVDVWPSIWCINEPKRYGCCGPHIRLNTSKLQGKWSITHRIHVWYIYIC